jgi:hypothetical protein
MHHGAGRTVMLELARRRDEDLLAAAMETGAELPTGTPNVTEFERDWDEQLRIDAAIERAQHNAGAKLKAAIDANAADLVDVVHAATTTAAETYMVLVDQLEAARRRLIELLALIAFVNHATRATRGYCNYSVNDNAAMQIPGAIGIERIEFSAAMASLRNEAEQAMALAAALPDELAADERKAQAIHAAALAMAGTAKPGEPQLRPRRKHR